MVKRISTQNLFELIKQLWLYVGTLQSLKKPIPSLLNPLDKRLKIMEEAVQATDKTVEKKKEEKKRGTTYID